jgi:hypothetical protein
MTRSLSNGEKVSKKSKRLAESSDIIKIMIRSLLPFLVRQMRSIYSGYVLGVATEIRHGVFFCCGLAILVLVLPGCGKKPPAQAQDPMMMLRSEPAAGSKTEQKTAEDLAALNVSLREYVKSKKVIPKDVNDLVTSGFVRSLPTPPPGQRFAIVLHPLGYQVILVNQ